ncbi:MAG TPA: SAM-dependent methyltransferase [Caldilineaceae bacterium]|nr:SAM-dependent methyltransferase [Caldilineaceae bacterium]
MDHRATGQADFCMATTEEQLILTANPSFLDLAVSELQEIGTILAQQSLADDVLLLTLAESFWEVAEPWRLAPPIFPHHICPVQSRVALRAQTNTDLAILQQTLASELLDLVDSTLPLSVQSRILTTLPYKPFDINRTLSTYIHQQLGVPIDVRAPHQVLSVVCADWQRHTENKAQTTAFLGVSPTVYNLSDWAGGMRRFAREEGQISRAEFKLLEALEYFHLDLPARGVALDLGASPGGWTRVLRQHDQYVTAVDPGELDPRIAKDRGVRHKRMTAEEYLANDPDRFDLIVNDMRMDARDSARLMVAYVQQLYRSGRVLMTLKLPEENRRPILDHALQILQEAYHITGARQLFHNRSEITILLEPLAG